MAPDRIDIALLRADLAGHLERIAKKFKNHPRLTLIVRHNDTPDHSKDVVLTDDSYDEAIKTLRWAKEGDR